MKDKKKERRKRPVEADIGDIDTAPLPTLPAFREPITENL